VPPLHSASTFHSDEVIVVLVVNVLSMMQYDLVLCVQLVADM
jgi:hypothetical protein